MLQSVKEDVSCGLVWQWHFLCDLFYMMLVSIPDIGDISRNCTEDGWSEPFPHYYDACGFDENETESENQVGIL